MSHVLPTTRAPFVRRIAAPALGLMLLTACSSGGTEGPDAATEPVQ